MRVENKWNPIDTAPRDGTVVELNGPHTIYPMRGRFQRGGWEAEEMIYHLGGSTVPDPTEWRETETRDELEPTPEMVDAGVLTLLSRMFGDDSDDIVKAVYRAMITAKNLAR